MRVNTTTTPRLCAGAAALSAALFLGGCGGSGEPPTASKASPVQGDQRAILDTDDALNTAGRQGDGGKVCDQLFTAGLKRSVEVSAGRGCAAEVKRSLAAPDEEISLQRDVEIAGSRASAVIREQNGNVSTLHLVKQGGRWRIAAVSPRRGE